MADPNTTVLDDVTYDTTNPEELDNLLWGTIKAYLLGRQADEVKRLIALYKEDLDKIDGGDAALKISAASDAALARNYDYHQDMMAEVARKFKDTYAFVKTQDYGEDFIDSVDLAIRPYGNILDGDCLKLTNRALKKHKIDFPPYTEGPDEELFSITMLNDKGEIVTGR